MVKIVNVLLARVFSEIQAFPVAISLFDEGSGCADAWCEECSGIGLEVPERC